MGGHSNCHQTWTIKLECNSCLSFDSHTVAHPIRWVFVAKWLDYYCGNCRAYGRTQLEHCVHAHCNTFDWERVKVLHFKLVLNVKSTEFNCELPLLLPLYGCNWCNRVLIICQAPIKFVTYCSHELKPQLGGGSCNNLKCINRIALLPTQIVTIHFNHLNNYYSVEMGAFLTRFAFCLHFVRLCNVLDFVIFDQPQVLICLLNCQQWLTNAIFKRNEYMNMMLVMQPNK